MKGGLHSISCVSLLILAFFGYLGLYWQPTILLSNNFNMLSFAGPEEIYVMRKRIDQLLDEFDCSTPSIFFEDIDL